MEPLERVLNIYESEIRQLTALARSIVVSGQEAEDVIQDVMVKLLSKPEQLDEVKNYRAFLYSCVRNEAIDHVRSLGHERPTADEALENLRAYASEEEYKEVENLLWVSRYIDSLPDDIREAFISHVIDGYSVAELSRKLNIPADTLRKRFDVVKKRMRGDLFLLMFILY